jgi:hypothetical protein
MMNASPVYPLYRKYKNEKSYFKILSPDEFEEIQVLGKRYSLHHFTVKILPDRNFIYDMTFDFQTNWEEITDEEYRIVKNKV